MISRRNVARLLVPALLLGAACTTSTRLARDGASGYRQSGLASWYGPGFHGNLTANGEVYDMNSLTAAHRELPFDTLVEVFNHDNGRAVRVRINDRGPFVRGRIIDLSRAAAVEIGMIRSGTARVTLRVIRAGAPAVGASSGWLVQAGAFRDRRHAERYLSTVRGVDDRARLASSGGWHRIVVGPFESRRRARKLSADLSRRGIEAYVRVAG